MRNSSFAHLAREFLFLYIPEPYILLLCSCREFLIFRINLVTVQTNFPWTVRILPATQLRKIKNGLHSRRVLFSDGHAVVNVSLPQLPHKLPIPLWYHPTSGLMQILHFDWLRYYSSISNSHVVVKFAGFVNLFTSFYSQINIFFC